jgi:hypothetical protein
MRILRLFPICCLMTVAAMAQAATRPVVITWAPSPSTSVTGYSIYVCSATATMPCTPSTTGTPALTATASSTSAVYQANIGSYYSISVMANGPACTGTSPIATPCGNSQAVTGMPNPLPVPPQMAAVASAQLAVP